MTWPEAFVYAVIALCATGSIVAMVIVAIRAESRAPRRPTSPPAMPVWKSTTRQEKP